MQPRSLPFSLPGRRATPSFIDDVEEVITVEPAPQAVNRKRSRIVLPQVEEIESMPIPFFRVNTGSSSSSTSAARESSELASSSIIHGSAGNRSGFAPLPQRQIGFRPSQPPAQQQQQQHQHQKPMQQPIRQTDRIQAQQQPFFQFGRNQGQQQQPFRSFDRDSRDFDISNTGNRYRAYGGGPLSTLTSGSSMPLSYFRSLPEPLKMINFDKLSRDDKMTFFEPLSREDKLRYLSVRSELTPDDYELMQTLDNGSSSSSNGADVIDEAMLKSLAESAGYEISMPDIRKESKKESSSSSSFSSSSSAKVSLKQASRPILIDVTESSFEEVIEVDDKSIEVLDDDDDDDDIQHISSSSSSFFSKPLLAPLRSRVAPPSPEVEFLEKRAPPTTSHPIVTISAETAEKLRVFEAKVKNITKSVIEAAEKRVPLHQLNESCSVCLEDMPAGSKVRLLPCYHRFHITCISKWLKISKLKCPVCKRSVQQH